jgi:hypothetical protein
LIVELQHAFKIYDVDKNGTMDMKEFKQVLKDLGKRDVTEETVSKMMAEHDQNKDSTLSWTEFLEVLINLLNLIFALKMFKQLKLTNGEQFSKVLTIKAGYVLCLSLKIVIVRYLKVLARVVSPTPISLKRKFASPSL